MSAYRSVDGCFMMRAGVSADARGMMGADVPVDTHLVMRAYISVSAGFMISAWVSIDGSAYPASMRSVLMGAARFAAPAFLSMILVVG